MKTTFPEDLKALTDEALSALKTEALAEFDTLYPADGQFASISAEAFADLQSLTAGLEAVSAEFESRETAKAAFAEMASKREQFARVTGTFEGETDEPVEALEAVEEVEPVLAASEGREELAVGEVAVQPEQPVAYATGEGLGVAIDTPLTWSGLAEALDNRMARFNVTPYREAAKQGRALKQVQSFAAFRRNIPAELMVQEGSTRSVVRRAIETARDVTRLKGGSLIASGGWGTPSQISYDRFPKLSSRDGIATFPTIGVERGGLQMPHGSTFAEVYANADFIEFTEEQDIAGEYAPGSNGNVVGTKPIYRIPPTEWVDHRLQVDGIHIQAGILESRGYPEGIREEVAQVLDAHAHYINAKILAKIAADSTPVTMTAGQVDAAAAVLSAIELQVLHYRDTHRMPFGTELEAKFPFWLRGAIRQDLSRRLGVDLLEVSDARIGGWFADRGVSVEWVYDWQSIATTAAGTFVQYPTEVSFLLYAAGTWVKGEQPVISLDTMYDSTLLGTNDYTVLFTEDGWFIAQAGPDSRVVTVPINPTGAAHIGLEIARTGAAA